MKCRSYTPNLNVKYLVVLTFQPDIVLVGFLQISCPNPSMTFTVMNQTRVSFYPKSSIPIRAYNKERRDVCDCDFIVSARFHGINSAVKHHSA